MEASLDNLFNPRSLALVGASGKPSKWGFHILFNILKGGYGGKVFPVNPGQEKVLGLPCFSDIRAVPERPDLAVIATPAPSVLDVVRQCAGKKIPNLIVVTSDFSETGPQGAELEKGLARLIQESGITMVGPNTMGIYSAKSSLHALMPPVEPLEGGISVFAQSGNVGVQMLSWGCEEGLGFEKFVSTGNEASLTGRDYLSYFHRDPATKIILGYVEGARDPRGFLSRAKKVSRDKPVILFKGGKTPAGNRAAASHTGSLAGSAPVYRGAFRQAGIVDVESSADVVNAAKAFANYPLPRGRRVAILTRGGGWGVITADSCVKNGLLVPPLPDDIIKKLDKMLPPFWSRANPVDLVAALDPRVFLDAIEMLAQWDGADAVIALGGRVGKLSESSRRPEIVENLKKTAPQLAALEESLYESQENTYRFMSHIVQSTKKPVLFVTMGSHEAHKKAMGAYDLVSFRTPEQAASALAHMSRYGEFKKGLA